MASAQSNDGFDPIYPSPFSVDGAGANIEVDSSPSDDNLSDASSTKSLRESIFNYIQENGRRYHAYQAGSYFLPNDEIENDRLDLQHYVCKVVFGNRDYFAPLDQKKVRRMLDIGTGTGRWAIDMAMQFPTAEVTGTDLSPIQPTEEIPRNLRFLVDDANSEYWGSHKYDYIHTRLLLGSFADFKSIIQRSFNYLEPGGWMESQEVYPTVYCDDDTLKPGNKFVEWTRLQDEAAMKMMRPLRIANKLKKWYEDVGFVDVHQEVFKLPVNGWPRDPQFKLFGKFWENSLVDGLQAFSLAYFHRAFGWTKEEIEVYLVNVREAIRDRSVHAYHKVYVVWGRKPYPGEVPHPEGTSAQPPPRPS